MGDPVNSGLGIFNLENHACKDDWMFSNLDSSYSDLNTRTVKASSA